MLPSHLLYRQLALARHHGTWLPCRGTTKGACLGARGRNQHSVSVLGLLLTYFADVLTACPSGSNEPAAEAGPLYA